MAEEASYDHGNFIGTAYPFTALTSIPSPDV